MSATGRNKKGKKRNKSDFYATPLWCTRVLLRTLRGWRPTLDPCAGRGAILRAARKRSPDMVGFELNLKSAHPDVEDRIDFGVNGLDESWSNDDVLTNPPYSNALDFVRKGIQEAESAVFLLRLNWLGSGKTGRADFRSSFLREHPPTLLVPLERRPSFRHGTTDACDYAWIGWGNLPLPHETASLIVFPLCPEAKKRNRKRKR